jgi:8-oxo-dGTP pyrophosphatase MutT (NUDIX family)
MTSPLRLPRLRASALVEFPEGVLLVSMRGMGLMLPGGGVLPGEREEDAAIRELYEETTLVARRADFLLHYDAYQFRHSVFWVRASGTPAPSSEIESLAFYQPGAALKLAPVTRDILAQVEQLRRADPARFALD